MGLWPLRKPAWLTQLEFAGFWFFRGLARGSESLCFRMCLALSRPRVAQRHCVLHDLCCLVFCVFALENPPSPAPPTRPRPELFYYLPLVLLFVGRPTENVIKVKTKSQDKIISLVRKG